MPSLNPHQIPHPDFPGRAISGRVMPKNGKTQPKASGSKASSKGPVIVMALGPHPGAPPIATIHHGASKPATNKPIASKPAANKKPAGHDKPPASGYDKSSGSGYDKPAGYSHSPGGYIKCTDFDDYSGHGKTKGTRKR